jgi:translation initiation factor 1
MRTTTPHEADFCLSTRNFSAYSTETGRICPDCSQPVVQCQCAARKRALAAAIANGGGAAADGGCGCSAQPKVRGGKSVTLVRGLAFG